MLPYDTGTISFGTPEDSQSRSSVLFYVPDGIAPWPQQPVGWGLEFILGFWEGRRELYDDVVQDLGLGRSWRRASAYFPKASENASCSLLACSLRNRLLIIDEPFEGLDLRQSRELEATLRKHVALGRTLFLSIHQIADAARICDRFVLLSNGNLVGEGTLETLSSMAEQRVGHLPDHDFEEIFLALT